MRTLRTNPVAFDQCRELVHQLAVRCIPTSTTADAAREVAESDDPTEAAIASAEAAARFGLHVIAPDVGDHAAFTRFVGIAPHTRVDRARALAHGAFVRHRPPAGLALPCARPVPRATASTSSSSCRGRSRSRRSATASTWCSTAIRSTRELQSALVEMREWTREVRIFGSYPATGDH